MLDTLDAVLQHFKSPASSITIGRARASHEAPPSFSARCEGRTQAISHAAYVALLAAGAIDDDSDDYHRVKEETEAEGLPFRDGNLWR